LRAPGKDEAAAISCCDEVVKDISMHELLARVDEVHVLTSLSGFEALLRGKPVTTYGQPFYAGWGLTRDLALSSAVAQRRTRNLTLDQLVAGTLILYPTYVSRTTGRFTTPERVLDELLNWRDRAPRHFPLWRWPLRLALQAWGGRR
jgi:capsular polysaccharide export protein